MDDDDRACRLREGRDDGAAGGRGAVGAADEGGGDAGALPPQVVRRPGGGQQGPVRQERRRQRAVQGVLLLRRRRRPGSRTTMRSVWRLRLLVVIFSLCRCFVVKGWECTVPLLLFNTIPSFRKKKLKFDCSSYSKKLCKTLLFCCHLLYQYKVLQE